MNQLYEILIQYGVLLGLMLANILGGTSLAALKQKFDKQTFYTGCFKVVSLALMIGALIALGYVNKDFQINGYTAIDALKVSALAGDAYYGLQVLSKIGQMIGLKSVPIKNK